jgi:3-oxoacyl-[acyl-carrier protein] reductase
MNIDLTGQVALVTGGGRGIGRAAALALARAGAEVVVSFNRSAAAAAEVVALVEGLGRRAEAVRADVARPEEVESLFGRLRSAFAGLDILVNNAGVTRDSLVGTLEVEDWDRVQEVNLRGPFLCTRAALPLMLPRGRGKIVNLASVAALRPGPGQAGYAAAKGGLVAFTRACAVELAPKGIQVNAVLPGIVVTEMSARLRRRAGEELLAAIPAGRFGQPEEIASVVLFLASAHADYLTGQAIVVDGGLCAT